MNSLNVTEITDDAKFKNDVMLDEKFLLVCSSVPFTAKLKSALLEWEFRQVMTDGNAVPQGEGAAPAPQAAPLGETEDVSADMFSDEEENDSPPQEAQERVQEEGSVIDRAQRKFEAKKAESTSIEHNQMNLVQTVYDEYLNFIEEIYSRFVTHRELEYERIAGEIKELCVFVNEHSRYILRIQTSVQDNGRTYLVNHALRSTVLSIAIALQLRMPIVKQIELGVACLVHEIGMLRLPPQIYMSSRPLTPSERNNIFTHPVLSYNILHDASFPLSVCLGALEHHEKESGDGYPRKVPGPKISLYAKIIAVSCAFEAITAPRFHKEAKSMYDAMIEMLTNPGKRYDEGILKALLFAVSLYPIGSYVFLHNGKIGQVVDVNPLNPKQPIVQLLGAKDANGDPITVQIGNDIRIVRTLSRQEILDILKTQKK